MKTNFDCKRRNAFTLIELLVVISIIAVLMGIMMPALGKARLSAQSVICKTRLKDLGSILYLYANDTNGKIPPSHASQNELNMGYSDGDFRWPHRLRNYYDIKSKTSFASNVDWAKAIQHMPMLRCPTQEKYTRMPVAQSGWLGSFGMNIFFTGHPAAANQWTNWQKFDQIMSPAALPLLAELSGEACSWATVTNDNGQNAGGGLALQFSGPHHSAYNLHNWGKGKNGMGEYSLYGPAPIHTSKSNYLLADGHTDSLPIWPWKDFIGTDFHPKRNVKVLPPKVER